MLQGYARIMTVIMVVKLYKTFFNFSLKNIIVFDDEAVGMWVTLSSKLSIYPQPVRHCRF